MSIELIYEQGCPNVQDARHALLEALTSLDMTADWEEWEKSDPGLPSHAAGFGSPTILVDGRDVAGEAPGSQSDSCRRYQGPKGYSNFPPVNMIRAALRENVLAPLEKARNPGDA